MSYNSSHLRTNSINFSPTSEDKQAALVASKHSKCSAGDIRLFTLSESSRYRPVQTRSVTSNILAQQRRRNGTETWRRRSCQCEHLRLITHEKIHVTQNRTLEPNPLAPNIRYTCHAVWCSKNEWWVQLTACHILYYTVPIRIPVCCTPDWAL